MYRTLGNRYITNILVYVLEIFQNLCSTWALDRVMFRSTVGAIELTGIKTGFKPKVCRPNPLYRYLP